MEITFLTRLGSDRICRSVLSMLLLATAGVSYVHAVPVDGEKPESSNPPNIIMILADDLGWSDTTLFGTTRLYRTPNIQALATRGMTFTRAYSASPLCSPTRASLLTGMSPARHGITSPTCHLPEVILAASAFAQSGANVPAAPVKSVTRLNTDYITLAEVLQQNGYRTGHFGKWHLGPEPYSALQHGFEVDVPHWPGPGPAGSYVAPWKFKDFDHDPMVPDQHIEDRMATEAVQFMEKNRNQPFFLNYWMFSVHAPFDAKQSLIDQYRERINPSDPQRSPTYAAMIQSMDDAVGALLGAIDRLGLAENTVIVFASDNGGNMYNEVDGVPPTSNSPLRGGKATIYEGGIRGPCVVVWPGQVEAGSVSTEVIQTMDFYPTLLDAAGITVPKNQVCDGLSLLPVLSGKRLNRKAIFTYFPHQPRVPDWLPPAVSVHADGWKLIRIFHAGESGQHRWKLYHLSEDAGETNDLALEYPEKVSELDQLIEDYLARSDAVVPLANRHFDPTLYQIDLEGVPTRPIRKQQRVASGKDIIKVLGWQPNQQTRLKDLGNKLEVKSMGNDPFFIYKLAKPLPAGDYTVRVLLSSESRGDAQWFWQEKGVTPIFNKDRSDTSDMIHDGVARWAEFQMEVREPILAFRFDPCRGKGTIVIESIEVTNSSGQAQFAWP